MIESDATIESLLLSARRIAVLGIKTEAQADQPSFTVPAYLASVGYKVIPVPVYYPEVTEILGQKVYRSLRDIPGEVDLLAVFRKPGDIPQHLEDILEKRPKTVWFQLGIRNDEIAGKLSAAGIAVVQDRCLMVDHRRLIRST